MNDRNDSGNGERGDHSPRPGHIPHRPEPPRDPSTASRNAGGGRSGRYSSGGGPAGGPRGDSGYRGGDWRPEGDPQDPGRPAQDDRGGDWRQGFGAYGMSGQRPAPSAGGGSSMSGRRVHEDEPADGYGFGSHQSGGHQSGGSGRGHVAEGHGSDAADRGHRSPWSRGGHGRPREDEGRDDEVKWPYLEPWAVPGPFTGRGPEGWTRSNESIRNDVCERLTRHGGLDASRIRVLVENGEVILEGRVGSRSAKRMAEDTAESVTGVRDIQNRLRIDYGDL